MEKLRFGQIQEANQEGIGPTVTRALDRLTVAQRIYPQIILQVVGNGTLARQIDLTTEEAGQNPRTSSSNPLSNSAGAYFLNEDVIGGSRVKTALETVNAASNSRGIPPLAEKIKLGPGIGFVEAPKVYRELKLMGLSDPNLTINYTAPFGTEKTRNGIKCIVDSKIDPEGDFFPNDGVFLTRGATEAIDLFMTALASRKPNSRVVFLGLSYYTGPFSGMQKGLTIDRLMKDPTQNTENAEFFPTPEQISRSLPEDTSALVLTMPNNPNGETYSAQDLTKLITIAKEKGLVILFDAIFENMYFDPQQNYSSQVLQTAYELGALENIVIVDSLSKTMNFPGERIGYLATTNQDMVRSITDITLARICNPPLTLEPVLQFEGLARRIKRFQKDSPNVRLEAIIDEVVKAGEFPFDKNTLLQMYTEWDEWTDEVLKFYKGNLEIVKTILNGSSNGFSPDNAAFNTLIKVAGLPMGTNNMDYLAKLMFTLATYTQVGPCFGLSQKVWDSILGVWSRITYACSREDLVEGLVRLITFTKFYAEKNFGDQNKFPVLKIVYENQV